MKRPLRLRLPRRRLITLGTLWGISLWVALSVARSDYIFQIYVTRRFIEDWIYSTRWAWPLAATAGFTVLTSPPVRRRWPQPTRRAGLAVMVAAGLIGLTRLALHVGLGKMLLTLGGVALVGLLAAWVLIVPGTLAPPLPGAVLERLSESERVEADTARLKLQNDLRTTALQAIAGLAVLAGAILAFQQLTEDRQQATADRELTRQGQASERFTRAIGQLGSDRREVQLGGIYGLEQIAKQAPDNRLAVSEVLVAYLHRRAPRPANATTSSPALLRLRAPDVQAALTVLGRRQEEPPDPWLDLSRLDLRGADLSGTDPSGSHFSGVDLTGSDLRGAELNRTDLTASILSEADLRGTVLVRTGLAGADLRGADLRGASFVFTGLPGADLSGADLRGTDLSDVYFSDSDSDTDRTNFRQANFRQAKANRQTRWPAGFNWRDAGVEMIPERG